MNNPVWIFEGSHGRGDVMAQLVGQYAAAMQDLSGGALSTDPLERLAAEMAEDAPQFDLAPRIERLFPPALKDDAEAEEFRRAAMSQQAADRFAAAKVVLEGLTNAEDEDVLVLEEEIDAWVKTFAALRASWNVELTGSADRFAEATEEDVVDNQAVAAVCDWLGYLLEEALASRYAIGGDR